MKKVIKMILIGLIILFLVLFLNKNNMYYENNKVLTDEAIKRFEEDLKEGKELIPSNYITQEKNYENRASNLGKKCSKIIENVVNKVLNKFLDSINT